MIDMNASMLKKENYMKSFWYHGRMYSEEDITNKLAEYEAIIEMLEKKVQDLEHTLHDISNIIGG